MPRMRADLLLVARGLVESRAKARAAIEAGGVIAGGVVVGKPSDLIDEDVELSVTPPHPWVSRGGVKLAHALDTFGVNPDMCVCLDIGASTGGFTQVLLQRGALTVFAVDVGHDQLHSKIANDVRVLNLEGMDARTLESQYIPSPPSLIVCDASFIGAAKVLPVPLSFAAKQADLIVLIKPQFEAGPGKGGVLEEAEARAVAQQTIEALDGLENFRFVAQTDSPIRGGDGNLELLAHYRRKSSSPGFQPGRVILFMSIHAWRTCGSFSIVCLSQASMSF